MKSFHVSVIIPVYNAADFVKQAVESALIQPQTAEVVLVEDGSIDNGWEICQKIASENNKIRLFRHPDGKNHGESASRNLAVQKSSCEYVAFLDADDFYLPDRFTTAEAMFSNDPELEGVYEAIGMYVEDEVGLQRWKDASRSVAPLTTMTKRVPPEELFANLIAGGDGVFSIVGLMVKRSIFEKTGYFDEILPLHPDTAFKFKAAAISKLAPGKLEEAVAMRRVHDHNRISAPRSNWAIYKMRLILWSTLWKWSRRHLDPEKQQLILKRMIMEAARLKRFNRQLPSRISRFRRSLQLLILPFEYPFVLKEGAFWRAFLDAIPSLK
jgi:glycosyltransferase involved in cell wall biosynthesis